MEFVKDELLNSSVSFLNGDVEPFRKVRSELNRKRTPFKIHVPTEDGTYTTIDEPESAKLKAKYS